MAAFSTDVLLSTKNYRQITIEKLFVNLKEGLKWSISIDLLGFLTAQLSHYQK